MKLVSRKYLQSLFLFIISVSGINLQAQEITYLNAKEALTNSEEKAFYRIETKSTGENTFLIYKSIKEKNRWKKSKLVSTVEKIPGNKFHVFGKKKSEKDFIIREILDTINFGYTIKETDENGNILFITEVLSVFPLILHGKCTTYDNDGMTMANLVFVNNKIISETFLFNPVDTTHSTLTKNPEFPGGNKNFRIEIARNVRYPVSAQINKENGFVYIKFLINEKGKIKQTTSARDKKNELTKEGIRVISSIKKKWQPAEINDKKVPVWYYAKISFNGVFTFNRKY